MIQWKETHAGNECLNGEGFYISFQPDPNTRAPIPLFNSDGGQSETALCIRHSDTWLILNGDFRAEYGEAFPKGLRACIAVYQKHRAEHRSSWSTDRTDERSFEEWVERRIKGL